MLANIDYDQPVYNLDLIDPVDSIGLIGLIELIISIEMIGLTIFVPQLSKKLANLRRLASIFAILRYLCKFFQGSLEFN